MTPTSGNAFRDGKVHVQRRMCPTCIFRAGNLMRLAPGRRDELVAEATANQSAITCHETYDVDNAVCRGFFDRHPTAPLQIADRLGMIELVDVTWSVRS